LGNLRDADEDFAVEVLDEAQARAEPVAPQREVRLLLGEGVVEHGVAGVEEGENAEFVAFGHPREE